MSQENKDFAFIPQTESANQQVIEDFLTGPEVTKLPMEVEPIKSAEDDGIPKLETKEEKKQNQQNDLVSKFLGEEEDEDDDIEKEKQKVKIKSEKDILIPKASNNVNNDEDDEEGSIFGTLTNDLIKYGIFSEDVEIDSSTPEGFKERFELESNRAADIKLASFIEQFGPDYRDMFEAIFVNGVNPKEYVSVYNEIVDFSELDLENELNQEKIVRQFYLNLDWDNEDIDAEIEQLRNNFDLENKSKRFHKSLIKDQAKKLDSIQEEAKQKQLQKEQYKNNYITSVQTILRDKVKEKTFDGIPFTSRMAEEVQDYLLVDKWKTPAGELLTDFDKEISDLKKPENFGKKVKIAALFKLLEKDPTLSTIQKTGVTKESNQIFESLVRQKNKISNPSSKKTTSFF